MLLDFTFANYKSVHEKITLSMERDTRLREDDIDATVAVHAYSFQEYHRGVKMA